LAAKAEEAINLAKKLDRLTASSGRSSPEAMPSFGLTLKLVLLVFFLTALVTLLAALVTHYSIGTILHALS